MAQSVVATIPLGRTPTAVAVNPVTNLIYVANQPTSSIQIIDGVTNTIATTLSLNFQPEVIAVNPTTNRIYATNFIRGLFVLDGTSHAVIANVSLPLGAGKIGVNATTNQIYVGNSVDQTITVIDGILNSPTENSVVTVIPLPGYFGGDIAPNTVTNKIWVGLSVFDFPAQSFVPIAILDGPSNTVADRLFIDVFPGAVAVNEVTNMAYMVNHSTSTDVVVIDGESHLEVGSIHTGVGFGASLSRIAVNPTTNHVIVTEPFGEVVHIMDANTNTLITRMDLGFFGPFPSSLAVNATTSFVYVANIGFDPNNGGQSISVIDDPPPPATQLQSLIDKVRNYNLAQGITNSLDAKLQNALAAVDSLNQGNSNAVCNKLDSFINEVEAQNRLTTAQAADLSAAANRIRRTIGCG
jgi:DNA-binding beta-propeller fold protein YncE